MNKDIATTIIGSIGAIVYAIQPILESVNTAQLQPGQLREIFFAGVIALLGYLSNKK